MKQEVYIKSVVKTTHHTMRYKATGKVTHKDEKSGRVQWFVLFLDEQFKIISEGAKTPPPTEEEKEAIEEAIKPYRVRALLMKR